LKLKKPRQLEKKRGDLKIGSKDSVPARKQIAMRLGEGGRKKRWYGLWGNCPLPCSGSDRKILGWNKRGQDSHEEGKEGTIVRPPSDEVDLQGSLPPAGLRWGRDQRRLISAGNWRA